MTQQELFETITKIVASPHTTLTEHDKRRAIQVFLAFDDFLCDHLKMYRQENCDFDFGAIAGEQIDILEGK